MKLCCTTCQDPGTCRDFVSMQSILVAGIPQANKRVASHLQPWFSLSLLVSSPLGSWLCMEGTGAYWQWQLSQCKAELGLSQKGAMERGHPSTQFCTSCPRHRRNRPSANTPLFVRDPLAMYLGHSAFVKHQVSVLLQPNRPCTRCSERHQPQYFLHIVPSPVLIVLSSKQQI